MKANSGNGRRRHFPPELKLQAIQEARQGGVPISQVCEKYGIYPSPFYRREKAGERAALEALRGRKRGRKRISPREEQLLGEIDRLRDVIAELSAENLQLKKGRWR